MKEEEFTVEEVIFPNTIESKSKTRKDSDFLSKLKQDDNLVAFVSGLNFGKSFSTTEEEGKVELARNEIISLLAGGRGLKNVVSKIKKLFILGSTLYYHENQLEFDRVSYSKTNINIQVGEFLLANIKKADEYFSTLSKIIPITVLPGSNDITQDGYPQEPMKPLLFPKSFALKTFNLVSNPFFCKDQNKDYIITSGQNIDSMMKYSSYERNENIMMMLKSGHLSPSYPDMLR